jgi:nicotinamide riboside kinase
LNKRIGLIGSQGTGKSTLAKLLSKKLGLPLITEQARSVAEQMGFKSIDNLTKVQRIELQANILHTQILQEKAHRDTGFVADRTVIDNLAYWQFYSLKDTPEYHGAAILARRHMRDAYDLLVFLRPEFPIEDDGFRFACPHCQRVVDMLVEDIVRLFELNCIEVRGSTEARAEQVFDYLRSEKICPI